MPWRKYNSFLLRSDKRCVTQRDAKRLGIAVLRCDYCELLKASNDFLSTTTSLALSVCLLLFLGFFSSTYPSSPFFINPTVRIVTYVHMV
jgi:hypothetical protein